MEEKKILVIDIETTGFLQKGGKIVEVGIVELDLSTGNRNILFSEVCREDGITKEEVENSWIVANSSLTTNEIKQSDNLKHLQGEIQRIIDEYPLGATAFNNTFDFGFMEDRGFSFSKKLPCPMMLSTDICKIPNKNGYKGFKWPKVEEAYDFFFPNRNYVEEHRGADDAFHEARIVFELYERGVFTID